MAKIGDRLLGDNTGLVLGAKCLSKANKPSRYIGFGQCARCSMNGILVDDYGVSFTETPPVCEYPTDEEVLQKFSETCNLFKSHLQDEMSPEDLAKVGLVKSGQTTVNVMRSVIPTASEVALFADYPNDAVEDLMERTGCGDSHAIEQLTKALERRIERNTNMLGALNPYAKATLADYEDRTTGQGMGCNPQVIRTVIEIVHEDGCVYLVYPDVMVGFLAAQTRQERVVLSHACWSNGKNIKDRWGYYVDLYKNCGDTRVP